MPLWLTIAAFAGTQKAPSDAWKTKLNAKLLELKDRKIQVTHMLSTSVELSDALLSQDFEADLSGISIRGNSEIGLKYFDAEGRLTKYIKLPVTLLVQYQVPVAARVLARGVPVQTGDFKMEWRDASAFSSAPARMEDLLGRVVRNQVREDDVVYESSLEIERLISKGDRVRVAVIADGLMLSTTGIAQEPGIKGQTIKVLNIDSKKEIFAVVTDTKSVEVRL